MERCTWVPLSDHGCCQPFTFVCVSGFAAASFLAPVLDVMWYDSSFVDSFHTVSFCSSPLFFLHLLPCLSCLLSCSFGHLVSSFRFLILFCLILLVMDLLLLSVTCLFLLSVTCLFLLSVTYHHHLSSPVRHLQSHPVRHQPFPPAVAYSLLSVASSPSLTVSSYQSSTISSFPLSPPVCCLPSPSCPLSCLMSSHLLLSSPCFLLSPPPVFLSFLILFSPRIVCPLLASLLVVKYS